MNLPEALRKQKETFLQSAPSETVETMKNAIGSLESSGILNGCLKAGATAPDFILEDVSGESIRLYSLLENGPVILKFFRGDW